MNQHPLLDGHRHTNERDGRVLVYRNGLGWQAEDGLAAPSATAGIGYGTGAGGTVTQLTSKTTGVTLNTICGAITMNGAALGAAAEATFTVTDSAVAAADLIIVNHSSAGTIGAYLAGGRAAAGSFQITVSNVSAGSLSEAIVLSFAVIKAVTA